MSFIVLPKHKFDLLNPTDQAALLSDDATQSFYIDPLRSAISPENQKKLLREVYDRQLIDDGLSCRKLHFVDGKLYFKTDLSLPSFMGFVFEAFFVRAFNADKLGKGKNAFCWCTERPKRLLAPSVYYEKWKALGTGHLDAKNHHPYYSEPGSNSDVIFIRESLLDDRWERATVNGSSIPAGIQVKAITKNEGEDIVDALVDNKYQHVLTCLRHGNGVPSYSECVRIIQERRRFGTLSSEKAANILGRIASPEMLGFEQREIDEYQAYIASWYAGMAQPNEDIRGAIKTEIAVTGYHFQGSILLPD